MEKFDLLSRAMTHLHAGHPELARPPLERLRALLGPESDLDDTPYRYYLAALSTISARQGRTRKRPTCTGRSTTSRPRSTCTTC